MMQPPIMYAVALVWLLLMVLSWLGIIGRDVTTPGVLFTAVAFVVWLAEVSTREWRAEWRAKHHDDEDDRH